MKMSSRITNMVESWMKDGQLKELVYGKVGVPIQAWSSEKGSESTSCTVLVSALIELST